MKEYFDIQLGKRARLVLPSEVMAETIAVERGAICPIPGITDAYLGVLYRRGQLLWVLDLAEFLSASMGLKLPPLPEGGLTMSDRLTLVVLTEPSSGNNSGKNSGKDSEKKTTDSSARKEASQQSQIICAVSAVRGIVSLHPGSFEPLPPKAKRVVGGYFSGLAEIQERGEDKTTAIAAVLNVAALFAGLETNGKA
ncbi:MAG: chemotaxis protein CheW [Oscillatoria sp. SIO1A7]|nr:chemotaxis protein CheW [Oscillatoria sp. SIO1A7]